MKIFIYPLLSLLFLLSNCVDDDDNTSQRPTLPAITTEGLNTFGAMVDGEIFIPQGIVSGGTLSASYQCFINPLVTERDSCYLQLNADNRPELGGTIFSLNLFTTDKKLCGEDCTMTLAEVANEDATHASYGVIDLTDIDGHFTTHTHTGELHILRFDYENRILSGTFWFDAINEDGDIVEVRDGRFDVRFTI